MLQNFGTALSREQMKMVKGGDDAGGASTSCTCDDGSSWYYTSSNPIPTKVLTSDVKTYCPGGNGSCKAIGLQTA